MSTACFFTMVAVDDDRKPVPVPQLRPVSSDEKRRFESAQMRRKLRDEFSERMNQGARPD